MEKFWQWIDERLGLGGLRYPVPEHGNNLAYSLGGLTFVTILLLTVTGFILAQFYNPSPESAHQSVRYIVNQVPGGRLVRGVHYWLANIAIFLAVIHMIRVFITASYKKPREFNWLIGVLLFVTTGLIFYTGTVLKWDQEGFEALEHMSEIGALVGPVGSILTSGFTKSVELLGRVFALHISILIVSLLALAASHFLIIKRLWISPLPWGSREEIEEQHREENKVPFTSHIVRLSYYGLIVLLVVLILATFSPAPLGSAPKEGVEITKPPLPFIWLTPLETRFGVVAIPIAFGLLLLGLAAWPFLERTSELDPRKRPLAMALLIVVVIVWISLTIYGYILPMEKHV